jgi:hypothetical protein
MKDQTIATSTELDAALDAQSNKRRNALLRKTRFTVWQWILMVGAPVLLFIWGILLALDGDIALARGNFLGGAMVAVSTFLISRALQRVARRQLEAEFPNCRSDNPDRRSIPRAG